MTSIDFILLHGREFCKAAAFWNVFYQKGSVLAGIFGRKFGSEMMVLLMIVIDVETVDSVSPVHMECLR